MPTTTNKYISFALFILFFVVGIVGCSDKQKIKNEDKALLDSLEIILTDQYASNPLEAKQIIIESLPKINDSLNYYILLNKLAICSFYLNQLDSTLYYSNRVMSYLNSLTTLNDEEIDLAIKTTNDMGVIYQIQGNSEAAISYLEQAKDYSLSKDEQKLISIYINLADNYYNQGDFLKTCDYYRKALLITDSLDISTNEHYPIYSGLARLYTDLGNYSEAEQYYQYLENKITEIPPFEKFWFINSRGYYYYLQKEYQTALSWFKQALVITQTQNFKNYESVAETNIGEVFLMMNELDSARVYLEKAFLYYTEENPNPASIYYIKGLLASLYLSENKLAQAEHILNEIQEKEKLNPTYTYNNNKRLEELYRKKGDYSKAYSYKIKNDFYNDSILNWKIQNNILEIDSRYRQDTTILKKNILIKEAEETVDQLKNLNLFLILVGIIIILLFLAVSFYRKRQKEIRLTRQKEVIVHLRMENIRNRVSPHFIFNVLNAVIPSMRQHEELYKPMYLIVQAIRENLLISEKIAIPLKKEIAIVKNYIELLESIGSLKSQVVWQIGNNLSQDTFIPSMCIQIPVENALKYAFDSIENHNLLSINISSIEDFLSITIEDNGCGFNTKTGNEQKGTGNGFKILYKTIELLNEKNSKKIELQIKSRIDPDSSRGTSVSFLIPYNYIYPKL
ncbi:tetratricopeptide repeat protein [Bacteroidales bacterium OttesenSCG-928-M11]|nr:tetratricopeptide repeat protein [Bacteroidales bacterium OttesenSCG-928-M11]